jgi:excinuclease ABC subunit B
MRGPRSFQVVSPFKPTGDQPGAIQKLVDDLGSGRPAACLLGATGTGKTFTMANVIQRLGKPTLIISHNKTLAAQLYEELREFFPHNSVNYFVSYYDYYQPEAYIPQRDIYIEKDSSRNDDLDALRLAATSNILSRRDTIVVASVSCIFGLGSPIAYGQRVMTITRGGVMDRREFLLALNAMQYNRVEVEFKRATYRVRGDAIEIWPSYEKFAVRIELFGEEIDSIELVNPTSGEILVKEPQFFLFPAIHHVMPEDQLERALSAIREELDARVMQLRSQGKLLEAQRLLARTKYDLELLEETGTCPGIENYSRFMDGRAPGERPYCLMDYFDFAPPGTRDGDGGPPSVSSIAEAGVRGYRSLDTDRIANESSPRPNARDWLMIIDESHATMSQVRAMFNGDRARKEVLVEHGFRLPSALDNRPLRFEEFEGVVPQVLFVSATPGPYELEKVGGDVAEQVIRPTGLVDPEIDVRPARGQIPDLLERCRAVVAKGERVLVTALTKRLCEDLARYLDEQGLKVRYLHSEIETLDRVTILSDLREGTFDVLVGVNLLREGLDLPEVSLVCILDADKEGFLRSPTSLIQQMGRAARNVNSRVVMYADAMTPAMRAAIDETERRRAKQIAYNKAHGITPTTIKKAIRKGLESVLRGRKTAREAIGAKEESFDLDELIRMEHESMLEAAGRLEFEKAAALRDRVNALRKAREASGPDAGVRMTRSEVESISDEPSKKKRPGTPGTKVIRRGKSARRGAGGA